MNLQGFDKSGPRGQEVSNFGSAVTRPREMVTALRRASSLRRRRRECSAPMSHLGCRPGRRRSPGRPVGLDVSVVRGARSLVRGGGAPPAAAGNRLEIAREPGERTRHFAWSSLLRPVGSHGDAIDKQLAQDAQQREDWRSDTSRERGDPRQARARVRARRRRCPASRPDDRGDVGLGCR